MANQKDARPQSTAQASFLLQFSLGFVITVMPMMVPNMQVLAAPASPPVLVAASPPDVKAEGKTEGNATAGPPATAAPPAPATRTPPEQGPFLANKVYSVTPSEPLGPVDEETPAPEWYAITRGRFVGVVDQFALSAVAISGVAHGARKAYTTQNLALDAFNQALTWGGVQVV
ncbi:hypothetical protein B0H10DRAFT_2216704 [Mycena sp. CBHHK59/15]|nr:hypothetical protein B0H10DRAFT_2216704 [Mycena sp. CBHHK59/15]